MIRSNKLKIDMTTSKRFISILLLIITSSIILCIQNTVMNGMSTVDIVRTTLEIVTITLIAYVMLDKLQNKIQIGRKEKIVSVILMYLVMIIPVYINLLQVLESNSRIDRLNTFEIGSLQIYKVDYMEVMIFAFPIFSLFITEIFKKKKNELLKVCICLFTFELLEYIGLWGLRLSSMLAVAIINAVVTFYILRTKLSIGKAKSAIISMAFLLTVIVSAVGIYYMIYQNFKIIALRYYLSTKPLETRGIFRSSQAIGISNWEHDYIQPFTDLQSPICTSTYYFGYIAAALIFVVLLILLIVIFRMGNVIERFETSNIKKTISFTMTSYIMSKIIFNTLFGLAIPTLPMESPFLLGRFYHYTFTVLGGGAVDLAIVTLLAVFYISARRCSNEK